MMIIDAMTGSEVDSLPSLKSDTVRSVTQVTRFIADDGQAFASAKQAEAHNHLLDLAEWYEKESGGDNAQSVRLSNGSVEVEFDDLIMWIQDHLEEASAIVNAIRCRGDS